MGQVLAVLDEEAKQAARIARGNEAEKKRKRELARTRLGMDSVRNYNFGFCGQVKAGKSSLLNGMLGKKDTDQGAAKVAAWECTQKIKSYKYMRNGVFWDIPGAGTMSVNSQNYFEENFLYAFDCLLLLIHGSLRAEDIIFARLAVEYEVPIAFVRSKCDQDLTTLAEEIEDRDPRLVKTRRKFLTEMQARFDEEIQTQAPDLKSITIFFVSSKVFKDMASNSTEKLKFMLEETLLTDTIANKVREQRMMMAAYAFTYPNLIPWLLDSDDDDSD